MKHKKVIFEREIRQDYITPSKIRRLSNGKWEVYSFDEGMFTNHHWTDLISELLDYEDKHIERCIRVWYLPKKYATELREIINNIRELRKGKNGSQDIIDEINIPSNCGICG